MSMAHMSLRWILDHDAVFVVIPGASRDEQIPSNCATSNFAPLPAELHGKIKDMYNTEIHDHIRGPY